MMSNFATIILLMLSLATRRRCAAAVFMVLSSAVESPEGEMQKEVMSSAVIIDLSLSDSPQR